MHTIKKLRKSGVFTEVILTKKGRRTKACAVYGQEVERVFASAC